MYAWVEVDEHGVEGIIAAQVPGMPGAAPLVSTRRRNAALFRHIAQIHRERTDHTVRLISWSQRTLVEEL